MLRVSLLMSCLFISTVCSAHGVRSAYLDVQEEAPGEFSVLWKTQTGAGMGQTLMPEFSGRIKVISPPATRPAPGALVQTWRLRAIDPLRGQTLSVAGLDDTVSDVLVRMVFADGTNWIKRLTPAAAFADIPAAQSGWSVASEYLLPGVEHILFGADHLLFVLALLLVTQGRWRLVKAITAFTVAHSITLGLAALGVVQVPSPPVEAIIALSIVFVALEIIRARRGHAGFTANAPWLVAFVFGLLHGFGFAGALTEIGMPAGHIPTALLYFNIGVELGQLVFIACVLSFLQLTVRLRSRMPNWTELLVPYAIGCVAMFWAIQRTAGF